MENILISMPINIPVQKLIFIIETGLKEHSEYECKVTFRGKKDEENVYKIESNDGPDAFYCIGIIVSSILSELNY